MGLKRKLKTALFLVVIIIENHIMVSFGIPAHGLKRKRVSSTENDKMSQNQICFINNIIDQRI